MAKIVNWHSRLRGQAGRFVGWVSFAVGDGPRAVVRVFRLGRSGHDDKVLVVEFEDREEIRKLAVSARELADRLDRLLTPGDPHEVSVSGTTYPEAVRTLAAVVPQTFGEAIQRYPWLRCEGHEWDNRTTPENAAYLIRELLLRERADDEIDIDIERLERDSSGI